MTVWKRILLGAAISWGYSTTLALLFAARASGSFSLSTLLLPGVIPVALITSTVVAIGLTPIAAWSVRTGVRNVCLYGPILWVLLAAYLVLVVPEIGAASGQLGLIVLSIVGLVILGFIPRSSNV